MDGGVRVNATRAQREKERENEQTWHENSWISAYSTTKAERQGGEIDYSGGHHLMYESFSGSGGHLYKH